MTSRTLDWRLRHDKRSLSFRIADHFGTKAPLRTRNWTKHIWLDQGQEGACTGFGTAHTLACTPRSLAAKLGIDNAFAQKEYHGAQRFDEYPGEDYEGSSVLGVMKYAKSQGQITDFYWATTLDEILHCLSNVGPMVIGVNWYTGMFEPDANGMLHATGRMEGGHAPCLRGIDVRRQTVKVANSWGKDWGVKGDADLSWTDLDRLRREQGEFAFPVKPIS